MAKLYVSFFGNQMTRANDLVYTMRYGPPEIKDKNEALKVFLGTVMTIGAGVGLFAIMRSLGMSTAASS